MFLPIGTECLSPIEATCNSCNTGNSALPDMYAWRPASADISGNAQVPVLQLICYTSSTLKIYPNLFQTTQDSHYDYGIFNTNVSMTFIYTIHPTSFDYGSLLNVCFADFTEQERLQW